MSYQNKHSYWSFERPSSYRKDSLTPARPLHGLPAAKVLRVRAVPFPRCRRFRVHHDRDILNPMRDSSKCLPGMDAPAAYCARYLPPADDAIKGKTEHPQRLTGHFHSLGHVTTMTNESLAAWDGHTTAC